MNIHKIFSIMIIIIFSGHVETLYAVKLKPTNKPLQFKMKTIYGEKISHFVLKNKNNKAELFFYNNSGLTKNVKIDSETLAFINHNFESLPQTQANYKNCSRNFMEVQRIHENGKIEQRQSCDFVDKKSEKPFIQFANTLSYAIKLL